MYRYYYDEYTPYADKSYEYIQHRQSINNLLLSAKKHLNLTFQEIADYVGGSKEWIAAVIYGQASMTKHQALRLTKILQVSPEIAFILQEAPMRGSVERTVPIDPVIYRFYEIMQVYGVPIKALINEMFGDGIMSAIDLEIQVDKRPDPEDQESERVVVTFDGKFLPFKPI